MFNRGTLENLKQKATNVAQSGVAKSKQLAEIAKLRANCISEEEAIKKAYIEIGKLYYAERGDAPEGAYVALCSRISKAKDTIAQNHAEIEMIRSKDQDDDIVLDYQSDFVADDLQEASAIPVEDVDDAPCCCNAEAEEVDDEEAPEEPVEESED